ncbi:hypothetical protein [Geomicrobium sp. JCM 19037]|uniref:hypothetical protein n=1 Tax=Geomicrobium sp. JCM 19037 TaxID=1460634 RepID=UPI0005A7725C|nr:hypothetical protein [Geomicrobium sp. JCM 19037]
MKWLIYLYPKPWRKRYGEELGQVVEHTGLSIKIIIDLLLGIFDAWHVELRERTICGIRLDRLFVLMSTLNVFLLLQLISLREVILLEQIALIIAMLSFLLAVCVLLVNVFKLGITKGLSLNTKLGKLSMAFMGSYALFFVSFLVLAN